MVEGPSAGGAPVADRVVVMVEERTAADLAAVCLEETHLREPVSAALETRVPMAVASGDKTMAVVRELVWAGEVLVDRIVESATDPALERVKRVLAVRIAEWGFVQVKVRAVLA